MKTRQSVPPVWPKGYVFRHPYTRDLYSAKPGLGLSIYRYLMRASTRQALRILPKGSGRWLEVGCGPGAFLVEMSRITPLCVGLDIDRERLSDAVVLTRHHLGSSCVVRASAYALPFPSDFFDGLVCLETLEHLEVIRFLAEASRVLRAGGHLIFSVPVEIGSALVLRQAARRFLGMECLDFAPIDYPRWDFLKMSFRIGDRDLYRKKHKDHMFFSYRGFLDDLDRYFKLERLIWYPLPFPGPWSFNLHG